MAGFELEFVEWLRSRQKFDPRVALGIGDDMAAVSNQARFSLLTCDMLLDGVHFDLHTQPLRAIGRKAIACSLSDCAAMAVRPVAATVSLALPRAMSMNQVQELFEGMLALSESFDLAIVGGDTNRWEQSLAIDVSILAEPFPDIDPVTRAGARSGDGLFVTGALGGSRLGRHMTFTPRVHEARRLAEACGVELHAMMDLSDGLSLDLWRLCQASEVGAQLEEKLLLGVIHPDAHRAASLDGRSALDHALSDGEDFELLFAACGNVEVPGVSVARIGQVVDTGSNFRRIDGSNVPLEPRGYVH